MFIPHTNHTFIDSLVEKESHISSILNEIKQSGLPVFLFGAGARAEVTFKALADLGTIEIDEVVVDDEYVRENETFFGKPVKAFSAAISGCDTVNIIIGITAGAKRVENELEKNPKVKNVYFLDIRPGVDYTKPDSIMACIRQNHMALNYVYQNLSDEKSRQTMLAYFNQIISGTTDYIHDVYENNQYFPQFIALQENEVFVDCGAYDGDTIHDFLSSIGNTSYSKIYAFEPDILSFNKLIKLQESVSNLHCFKAGTWNEKKQLRFSNTGGHGSSISQSGEIVIDVDTIDRIVQDEKVTYIKMDVEGAEYESLQGAEKIIKEQKPKLAICVYHKIDDLVLIPAFLEKLVPEYRFYLRAHFTPYADELVLYATIS